MGVDRAAHGEAGRARSGAQARDEAGDQRDPLPEQDRLPVAAVAQRLPAVVYGLQSFLAHA